MNGLGSVVHTTSVSVLSWFFFFQAEDGIRDADVTGVQTCALPISSTRRGGGGPAWAFRLPRGSSRTTAAGSTSRARSAAALSSRSSCRAASARSPSRRRRQRQSIRDDHSGGGREDAVGRRGGARRGGNEPAGAGGAEGRHTMSEPARTERAAAELTREEAAHRIEELRSEILRHRKLYYVDNQPEIDDTTYDLLE